MGSAWAVHPLRLSPSQRAEIPLRLAVPAGAKPGQYLSDNHLDGGAAVSRGEFAGQAKYASAVPDSTRSPASG
jgi:hypothetical protein